MIEILLRDVKLYPFHDQNSISQTPVAKNIQMTFKHSGNTSLNFAILQRGITFVTSYIYLIAQNWPTLKEKSLLPGDLTGSNKGGRNEIAGVASPENVSLHLKFSAYL